MPSISGNVGTKVVFENDKIKVWDFVLEPVETTEMHHHDKSYIWYAVEGGFLDCDDEHGNDLGVFEVPTGSVWDIKCNEDNLEIMSELNNGTLFPRTHNAKNSGDSRYREILIEFKD